LSQSPACKKAIAKVASTRALFGALSAVLSFISNPLMGHAADVVGRRPIIILSVSVGLLQTGCFVLVGLFGVSIYVLFIFQELAALMPGIVAHTLWVIDNTSESSRAKFLGRYVAATSLEGIITPLFSSVSSRGTSIVILFMLAVVQLFVAVCLVPESHKQHTQVQRSLLHMGPLRQRGLMHFHETCGNLSSILKRPLYRRLVLLCLLGNIVAFGTKAIFYLFMKGKFGLTVKGLGPIAAFFMFFTLVVNLFLVKPLEKRLGLKWLIVISLLAGTLSCLLIWLAPYQQLILLAAPFNGLSTVCTPALIALFSIVAMNTSGERDVGPLMGTFQSITTIGQSLGPLIFQGFLGASENTSGPGAVWILGVVLNFVNIVCIGSIPRARFPDTQPADSTLGSAD